MANGRKPSDEMMMLRPEFLNSISCLLRMGSGPKVKICEVSALVSLLSHFVGNEIKSSYASVLVFLICGKPSNLNPSSVACHVIDHPLALDCALAESKRAVKRCASRSKLV